MPATHAAVGVQALGDDDRLGLGVAASVSSAGVADGERVAELGAERGEARQQFVVAVATDLGDRRGQRRRRGRGRQLLDLVLGEDVDELVDGAGPLVGVRAGVAPRLHPLAARFAARPDPDRPGALGNVVGPFADAVAEIQPCAEPCDAGRGGSLVADQEDVAPAVARESASGVR